MSEPWRGAAFLLRCALIGAAGLSADVCKAQRGSLDSLPLSSTLLDRVVGLPAARQRADSLLLNDATMGRMTSSGRSLRLEFAGLFDSNTLRNELVTGLWRGERLSRETRQRSDALQNDDGRAGYLLDLELQYRWGQRLFGDDRLRPIVRAGYHDVMGVRFTEDLYRVTFFGNADYEGRNAELGPAEYWHVRYQTIGFGAEWKKSGSYVLLQAVNGQHLSRAIIDEADLFTAIDGRYLRLDLNGRYLLSADAPDDGFHSNGTGGALSARWCHPVRWPFASGRLDLEVKDLGGIVWNRSSRRVERDSVIIYRGITVNDVFDLDGSLVGNASLQDTLGLGFSVTRVTTALPFSLAAALRVAASHAMVYEARIEYRYLPGYMPHGMIAARHVFAGRNAVRAEASYGGFGALRIGAGYERVVAHGVWLSLRTTNLPGLVSLQARGMSALLACEWRW